LGLVSFLHKKNEAIFYIPNLVIIHAFVGYHVRGEGQPYTGTWLACIKVSFEDAWLENSHAIVGHCIFKQKGVGVIIKSTNAEQFNTSIARIGIFVHTREE